MYHKHRGKSDDGVCEYHFWPIAKKKEQLCFVLSAIMQSVCRLTCQVIVPFSVRMPGGDEQEGNLNTCNLQN